MRKSLDAESLEKLHIRQKQASNNYRERLILKYSNKHESLTYKNRQALGKAVQRAL